MNEPGVPALLENAAQLVERALRQLDTTDTEVCGKCHMRRPTKPDHKKVYSNLDTVPERLRRGARILLGLE